MEIDGGALVVRALKKENVTHIFTLTGGHIAPIFATCAENGIRIIGMRHEEAVTHSAEGWFRCTREPGIAVVTAGPGVTNAVTGIANAFKSGAPIIIIAGRSSMGEFDKKSFQELDQLSLVKPIVKWCATIFDVNRIPEYLAIAFRQALSPPQGPVFVEIPIDVLNNTLNVEKVNFPSNYRSFTEPQPDLKMIEKAADLILAAKRPIAIAGSGIWRAEADKEFSFLVEVGNIPAFLNGMGRGCLPTKHKLHFPLARRYAMGKADVVCIIGTPIDFRLGYGQSPPFSEEAKVIQMSTDPREIGENRSVEIGIVGNEKSALKLLGEILNAKRDEVRQERVEWVDEVRKINIQNRINLEKACSSERTPINPYRLCKELDDFLEDDAIIIGDGGDIVTFGSQLIKVNFPGHWLDTGSFGCLGMGIPFAIAAKLANPNKQVVILNGDGSFGLNAMEFDTAIRYKIPIVSVIGNNACWGPVRPRYAPVSGPERTVAKLNLTRYDKMVEALGGCGIYVEKVEEIRPALREAFHAHMPACINVATDPSIVYDRVTKIY